MSANETCGNCRFWEETDEKPRGERGRCRAGHPQVVAEHWWDDDREEMIWVSETQWPVTYEWDWCGEWERKEG